MLELQTIGQPRESPDVRLGLHIIRVDVFRCFVEFLRHKCAQAGVFPCVIAPFHHAERRLMGTRGLLQPCGKLILARRDEHTAAEFISRADGGIFFEPLPERIVDLTLQDVSARLIAMLVIRRECVSPA